MKSMTCRQLGGACDVVFEAETFEQIAELSKQHGMEMYQKQEPAHLDAMNKIQAMMQNPEEMKAWYEEKKREFNAL
jgi:predicted component of type VI protein secretion system